ncbi:hypothetical protein FLP41_09975 [Paracoccus marcusii]|uniref:hypothetical protein n=1 Tax=Paracoccus marcusii TaxID=59779 RepID=UPI002ED5884C|nr:hypothetical protein FLP41_09975 [Paracoccus marcusii]
MTHVETRHAIHRTTPAAWTPPSCGSISWSRSVRRGSDPPDLYALRPLRGWRCGAGRAPLTLDAIDETRTPSFLDRREMGIVNIGGPGRVEAAGQGWDMANGDVLYLGMGAGR